MGNLSDNYTCEVGCHSLASVYGLVLWQKNSDDFNKFC